MIRNLILAIGFFTRIPVPDHPHFNDRIMHNTIYYFPLVGLLVGVLNLFIFWLSIQLFSVPIAVILSLGFSLLVTGGFHEDGWADTFDGLGGAFDRNKKLVIMSDSRLGSYGSLALFFILSIKVFTLIELLSINTLWIFLFAHGLSRWITVLTMVFCHYVRTEPNKIKSVAQEISIPKWLLSGLVLIPTWLFIPIPMLIIVLLSSLSICFIWIFILKKQLGGYTGDTLGAIQQSVEVTIYLSCLAYLS